MTDRSRTKLKALLLVCAANVVLVIAVIKYYKFTSIPELKLQSLHARRILDLNQDNIQKRCTPKKNIVFLKTHKTGSSTVTNIIRRYGDKHDLIFVLPKSGEDILGWPWFFQLDHMEQYNNVTPNILCNHARYNKDVMRKLMPNDTIYVTILRDPITQFESTFSYMNFGELLGISNTSDALASFLEKPKEILLDYLLTKDLKFYMSNRVKQIRNGMSFDLGLESKDFERPDRIAKAINEWHSQFDLVMLMEHFDESLVLLRRLMCWDQSDILYFHLNERKESYRRREYPKDLVSKIRHWSSADVALYEHFQNVLFNKLSTQQDDFNKEVDSFKLKNYYLKHMCLDSHSTHHREFGADTKGFNMRRNITTALRNTCDRMTWHLRFRNHLKKKQAIMLQPTQTWWAWLKSVFML